MSTNAQMDAQTLTDEEWRQWVELHAIAFPSVRDPKVRGNLLTKEAVARWRTTLGKYSLDELSEATNAMHEGRIKAYGLEQHPAELASWIREERIRNSKLDSLSPLPDDFEPITPAMAREFKGQLTACLKEIQRRVDEEVGGPHPWRRKRKGEKREPVKRWKARREAVLRITPIVMKEFGL